jgi:DNA-binding transcriptional MerR regulator
MNREIRQLWTIEELSAQVALALSVDYDGPSNGRVRDVPDLRTIRYYTTLGLLDRPAEMRGRTALYGIRHLLQLVAIKRLQAKGQSLGELEQQLLGMTDAELARIANLPAPEEVNNGDVLADRASTAFWMQPPGPVEKREIRAPASLLHMQGLALSDGVTLLMNAGRQLEPDDIEAIRIVAAPLLKLLEKRRLT